MSTIPEDGVTLKEESEAADEADPDKRNPPQLKDKQIEPDNEFDGAPGKSGRYFFIRHLTRRKECGHHLLVILPQVRLGFLNTLFTSSTSRFPDEPIPTN